MHDLKWHLFVHSTLKKLTQQTDNTTIYPLHLSKGTFATLNEQMENCDKKRRSSI